MRTNYDSIVHLEQNDQNNHVDKWLPLEGHKSIIDSDTSTNSSCTEISSESQALLLPWMKEFISPKQTRQNRKRQDRGGTPSLFKKEHEDDDDDDDDEDYYRISPNDLTPPQRNSTAADLRLAMISNFSTAYNVNSISLALKLMEDYHQKDSIHPAFEITATQKALCSSSLMAGMILGQLLGGMLGDIMGRHMAMTCVMLLQVIGALASSLSHDQTLFHHLLLSRLDMLILWRFVLGIGAGGVYPLAATLTSELKDTDNRTATAAQRVALTFSMQGWGYLTVPVVTWILLTFLPSSISPWRVLLGLGALPGMWLALCRYPRRGLSSSSSSKVSSTLEDPSPNYDTHDRSPPKLKLSPPRAMSVWDAIRLEPNLGSKLLGTGGCWFLFDVLFYGNTLFQPMVLSSAFGDSETVLKLVRDTTIIAALALPGYIVSVIAIGRYHQSPRYIQLQGFLVMAILYTIIGQWFYQLADYPMLLVILYSLTFFWSNYGPNSTTFLLPSMTFSQPCRGTLNGISAACGKLGALLGTILFAPLAVRWGHPTILLGCACLSMVGFVVTWIFVRTESNTHDEDDHDEDEDDTNYNLDTKKLDPVWETIPKSPKPPIKFVHSHPSLFDYFDEP